VLEAIDKSLGNLGSGYINLYLVHCPCSVDPDNAGQVFDCWTFIDTWREMQKLCPLRGMFEILVSGTWASSTSRSSSPTPTARLFLPSTRSNCILQTPCQDCSPTVPQKVSTARRIPRLEALIQGCVPARPSLPMQKRKTAHRNWSYSNAVSGTGQASYPNPSPRSASIKSNCNLDGFELSDDEFANISAISSRFQICGDS
jgi:glycerol 2-dehydrogenase (NADP+)